MWRELQASLRAGKLAHADSAHLGERNVQRQLIVGEAKAVQVYSVSGNFREANALNRSDPVWRVDDDIACAEWVVVRRFCFGSCCRWGGRHHRRHDWRCRERSP